MIRTSLICVVVAGLLAVGIVWTSNLTAEPLAPGSVGPAVETPAQAKELTDAMERFKQRDFEGAIKLLKEAVKKDPDLPPPNVIMAQWFAQANFPAGVQSALERAVIDSPDDPQAYLILADINIRERRLAEAGLLLEKAQILLAQWKGSAKRKDAMMPQLYNGLASAAQNRGDWAAAQKQLEAWLELDPKSVAAWQQLAFCLFRQKDAEGALAKLTQAAKLDSKIMQPDAVLAQWYARSGDQENAHKWLVAALTAAPKSPEVRVVAAQWALETGQLKEAAQQADYALQLEPNYYPAKKLRGSIALFQKDYKTAEMYFQSASIQEPNDFAASNNLALALIENQDEAKRKLALEYAQKNVELHKNSTEAYSTYGWVLYKLGRLQEADQALRAAVSGGTFSADTAYYLACVLAATGREADALQYLKAALKSTAPFPSRDEAKTLLDKLQSVQPQPQPQPLPQPQPEPQPQPSQPQPPPPQPQPKDQPKK